MHPGTRDARAPAPQASDAQLDRIPLLYSGVPLGVAGGIVAPAAVAWLLRGHVPSAAAAAWLAAQTATHAALALLTWLRRRDSRPDAARWLRRFRVCAFAIGMSWSMLPLLLFPDNVALRFFVLCVIVGSSGVVFAKLVPDLPSALLYLLPLAEASTLRLLSSTQPQMRATGLLVGLYFVFLGIATRATSSAFDASSRMRALNARLADYNAFLGQVHRAIALAADEAGLLHAVCEQAVQCTGTRLAWIGRPDANGNIRLLASAGPALGALDAIDAIGSAAAPPPGVDSGALATAWREQRALFNVPRPAQADTPWVLRSAAHGLDVAAVLPIGRHGQPWALLALYAARNDAFDDALQRVLLDLADGVSHGLDALEARRWTETLSEHSEAGMALLRDRRIVSANRRFAHMFGHDAADAVIDMRLRDLGLDHVAQDALDAQCSRLSEVPTVRMQSIACRRGDGGALPCDVTGARVDSDQSIWTFVDVARRDEERRQLLQLERLYRALLGEADVLLQARTEQPMLEQTCARLGNDAIFQAAWIGRPGADGHFRALASAGATSGLATRACTAVASPSPLLERAWREGAAVHVDDQLAIPVRRGDAQWAVLVLVAPQAAAFDAKTIELCNRVAALLGHALDEFDLKQRISQLQAEEAHRARHDPLTGLPNRWALEQYLPQAIARAGRAGTALAVGMIDLDDFKPVNDRHGHEAGDALLRELGARLQRLLRATDLVARLGGDEFVVVIEQLDRAHPVAELEALLGRLHCAIETAFDLGQGRRVEVGMSMGVALSPPCDAEPDALMRRADAAMYQVKADKLSRSAWWGFGTEQPRAAVAKAAPLDPFGELAQRLLGAVHGPLEAVEQEFVRDFYAELVRHDDTAAVLAGLAPGERARLQDLQAAHLRFLLEPHTTPSAIAARARHLGRVHALTGVGAPALTRATDLYRDLLERRVDSLPLATLDRFQALRAADARLKLDLHGQLDSMQQTIDAYSAYAARALPPSGGSWASLVQSELDALGALPGVRACQLARPRDNGFFAIEFDSGEAAEAMARVAMTYGLTPQLDARQPTGQGLIPMAWHSEEIQFSGAYSEDPRTRIWHDAMHEHGVRSMVAIPVPGSYGPEFVLVIEGAYPNQFSNRWMRDLCASLQNRWIQVVRINQPGAAAPLTTTQATAYRQLFHSGALCMDMQPVIDLGSGRLVKLEALDRLRAADGRIVAPGAFLPSLRDADLDSLFRQGLRISLQWLRRWRSQGLDVDLSLNLAPSTLVHPDCARWVAEALREHHTEPTQLILELLENQEFAEERRDEAINALRRVGVRLAIDDLGSGYSSLKRLASLNFDVIKADQSLIRDIAGDPVKTLSLVRTIVQIGRDFDREVVVEGLESAPIIEAVMRLGASQGQGYGLARPMPPEAVLPWAAQWRWDADASARIGSHLGALAYHWRYMHEDSGRYPMRCDDCPLHAFLVEGGHAGQEPDRLHRAVHDAPDAHARNAASRGLIDWLVARVRAEATTPA